MSFGANRIVLDWDGTLVENAWPGMGDWMPGAIEAVKRLHDAGYSLSVFSCRLSPWSLGLERKLTKAEQQTNINAVRAKLDEANLRYVEIWTKEGKPSGEYYIDDKGERYMGHVNSWKRLVDRILVREGRIDVGSVG